MCYNTVHLENGDIFGDLTIAIKTIFIIDTMLILKYYKKKKLKNCKCQKIISNFCKMPSPCIISLTMHNCLEDSHEKIMAVSKELLEDFISKQLYHSSQHLLLNACGDFFLH